MAEQQTELTEVRLVRPPNTVEYDEKTGTETKTFYRLIDGKYVPRKFIKVNGVRITYKYRNPKIKKPRKEHKTRCDIGAPRKSYMTGRKKHKTRSDAGKARNVIYKTRSDIGTSRHKYGDIELKLNFDKYKSLYEDHQLFESKKNILLNSKGGSLPFRIIGKLIMADPKIDLSKTNILISV